MHKGVLKAIFIAPDAGTPLYQIDSVEAVVGRGLKGDRYFSDKGSFSRWPGPHREVTLIAVEDLEHVYKESGIQLPAEKTRRNLLTYGIVLQPLIKKKFEIGSVLLEGVRLCQPCKYLARLLDEPNLVGALVHRGGLRARILSGGIIHTNDRIRLAEPELS